MNTVLCRAMSVVIAIVLTLGGSFGVEALPNATANMSAPGGMSIPINEEMIPSRATSYYLADRVINHADFAKLAGWGINTAVVDFDVNGSASDWRAVFTSAAAASIDVVIWPSDWDDPRPQCGWEAPYPVSATGDITKVKRLLDVASEYPNFIGIVNAHESFWTCDMSFDEMAGLKTQLKAYALSKGRAIKVWNYIDNLYDKSMLPDDQIERIMDVAMTWQHCAGNVEGTCTTSSSTSALNMILNDRKRIADSGAQVELVFIMQTFTTGGYSTKFTLNQLQDYSCQFLNTSALDGFGFYTWHAGWWPDLHSWTDLQPAIPYIYNNCTNNPGSSTPSTISGNAGIGGAILSYVDGTTRTITSAPDGSYSLSVSSHWFGTVTPSYPCLTFTPDSRSYQDVTTDLINEDYTAALSGVCVPPKPGVPVLLTPASGPVVSTLQPIFDWKDSAPAADHYQLQVSANRTFTDLAIDESDVPTSTFTPASDLLPGKLYYWRVKAFNMADVPSNWSIVRYFKTPLAQPTLVSPTGGAPLLTDRPAFDWDAVPGASSYLLQVSATANFKSLLVNMKASTAEYEMVKDLPQERLLYWRVAGSTSFVTGPWSMAGTFKTGNPPGVPNPGLPANNALNKDYRPIFKWSVVTVPVHTIFDHYQLQVDDNPAFGSPDVDETIATRTAPQFQLAAPLNSNTRYFWRVRSFNTDGHYSGWSVVRSFRTLIAAPQSLTVLPNGLRPSFDWGDATGTGTITSYTIQISTSPTFSGLLVNATTSTSTYTMQKDLPPGKTIYWRVRINGANGPSAWSTGTFTTP